MVKKTVLVFLFSSVCFLWGYLFLGEKLSPVTPVPETTGDSSGFAGPPAPVRQRINYLKKQILENPKDGKSYSELADFYFQADKFQQALLLYKKSVELNPQDIIARNNLAICYHLLHQEKEALHQLDRALQISPNSQHLWLTLGVLQYKAGKTAEARQALARAVHLNPMSKIGLQAKALLDSMKS